MYIVQNVGFGKIIMDVSETQTAEYIMYSCVFPIVMSVIVVVGVCIYEYFKHKK